MRAGFVLEVPLQPRGLTRGRERVAEEGMQLCRELVPFSLSETPFGKSDRFPELPRTVLTGTAVGGWPVAGSHPLPTRLHCHLAPPFSSPQPRGQPGPAAEFRDLAHLHPAPSHTTRLGAPLARGPESGLSGSQSQSTSQGPSAPGGGGSWLCSFPECPPSPHVSLGRAATFPRACSPPGLSQGSVCHVSSSPQTPQEGAACPDGGGTGGADCGWGQGRAPGSAPTWLCPHLALPPSNLGWGSWALCASGSPSARS